MAFAYRKFESGRGIPRPLGPPRTMEGLLPALSEHKGHFPAAALQRLDISVMLLARLWTANSCNIQDVGLEVL